MKSGRSCMLSLASVLILIMMLSCSSSDGGTEDGDQPTDGDQPADGDETDGDQAESDPDVDEIADGDPDMDADGDAEDADEQAVDGDPEPEMDGDSDGDTDGDSEMDLDPELDGDTDGDFEVDGDKEADEEVLSVECPANFFGVHYPTNGYVVSGALSSGVDNVSADCFAWDMNGFDMIFEVILYETEMIEVSMLPVPIETMEGDNENARADNDTEDLAIYLLRNCNQEPICLTAADEQGVGGEETFRFRAVETGIYYLVVDSRTVNTDYSFDLSIDWLEAGEIPVGEACQDDQQCDPTGVSGSGFCKGEGDFMVCSFLCEEDQNCLDAGFASGCCMDDGLSGRKFCQVAANCGSAGETAAPAAACASAEKPNLPLCDPDQQAGACNADTLQDIPYCSKTCSIGADCSEFADGCCFNLSRAGMCLSQSDCPQVCVSDHWIFSTAMPWTAYHQLSETGKKLHALSCLDEGTPGEDIIYTVSLQDGETLQVSLSDIPGWDPVLLVMEQCGWIESSGDCRRVADENGPGLGETLLYKAHGNEDITLAIDSKTPGLDTEFRVDFEIIAVDGDIDEEFDEEVQCMVDYDLSPVDLPFLLYDGLDNYTNKLSMATGCSENQMLSRDVVVSLDLILNDDVWVGMEGATDFNPILSVYSDCSGSSCLELHDDKGVNEPEGFLFTAPATGTYYFVLDAEQVTSGASFALSLSFPLPDGDEISDGDETDGDIEDPPCSVDTTVGTFADLPFNALEENTDTTGNEVTGNDGQNGCLAQNLPSNDTVYKIYLEQNEGMNVSLTNVSGNLDPVLIISSDCSGAVTCLGKANRNWANLGEELRGFTAPAAGDYYVIVDSVFPDTGSYQIQISPYTPVDGDIDDSEIDMSDGDQVQACDPAYDYLVGILGDGSYNQYGLDTSGSTNKFDVLDPSPGGPCLSHTPSKDHVFQIVLEAQESITVYISNISFGYDPTIIISSECSSAATCDAAIDFWGPGQGEKLDFTAPENGTYFIVVDSTSTNQSGAYDISIYHPAADGDVDGEVE